MHARALQLAAQRLAERVGEGFGCRVGRVVRDRRIAGGRSRNQDPAGLAGSIIPGSTASTRSCTPSTLSCTCAFRRPDPAWPPARTSPCPRWRTGSRCRGRRARRPVSVRSSGSARSTGRTSTVTPYCSVSRAARSVSTSSRRAVMIRLMATGGELGGQRLADVLRGTGDDGSGVRAGCGYWHGPDISWRDHERAAAAGRQTAGRSQVAVRGRCGTAVPPA